MTYQINVTVHQLSYTYDTNGKEEEVWSTIGYATVGPERLGQNININQPGISSNTMVGRH